MSEILWTLKNPEDFWGTRNAEAFLSVSEHAQKSVSFSDIPKPRNAEHFLCFGEGAQVGSIITSKKGISVWVSWVLIMGFAIALGVFFFSWIKGFAAESSEDIVERSDKITLCDSASVRIDKLCQDTQT